MQMTLDYAFDTETGSKNTNTTAKSRSRPAVRHTGLTTRTIERHPTATVPPTRTERHHAEEEMERWDGLY